MRNIGIRGLYKRGKIYYRLKGGKWESLGTTVRRDAVRLNRQLNERDNALKFFKKNGLAGLEESLRRVEEKVDQIAVAPEQKVLAPTSANPPRSDFAREATRFYDCLACTSVKTKTGWGTYHRALLVLVDTAKEAGKEDISSLGAWEKIEKLGPSGLWDAYKAKTPGPSSIDQFAMYLRKLVPDFVSKGFFPSWFIQNLGTIGKMGTNPRDLHIPPPEAMDALLNLCEQKDKELGKLIRAFAYSGARKGGLLGETGLTWNKVDLVERIFTLNEKGRKLRTIPMGPKLYELFKGLRERSNGDDGLVFPFGSTREDTAQEILAESAKALGAEVREMSFFHALRHYFRTQHMRQGTPDRVRNALTGHSNGGGRRHAGDGYDHVEMEDMRKAVEKVRL